MGARMRAFDWSATPVGPTDAWSQSLRTTLGIMLATRHPMFLWWGPDLVQFYNDGYRPSLGADRHPAALGAQGRVFWKEIWPAIGPQIEAVMTRGDATWNEDHQVPIVRNGRLEEVYWTYGYSPVLDDDGSIGGTLVVVQEVTARVIGERRLKTLRDLAACAVSSRTEKDAWQGVAEALATNAWDLPWVRLYPADGGEDTALPVQEVIDTGAAVLVENLALQKAPLRNSVWPEPVAAAWLLPLTQLNFAKPYGVLAVGLSPRLSFDEDYRDFLRLAADRASGAITNGRLNDQKHERIESLAALDRAKTIFFNNVSHEFRTPLTLMLGPLEAAVTSESGSLGRGDLDAVYRNARRMHRLVNTLLDFSRIQAGRLRATYRPTDLSALTAGLASTFRSAAESAGLAFSVDCPPLPRPVYVDHDLWEHVVLNLLSNALKFTMQGGIALDLRHDERGAVVSVHDSGIGIPADEIPRVFERFHRAERVQARTHEGTGIGLSLVDEVVKLHGGTVGVRSAHGEGSTFIVTVPFGREHLPPGQVEESPAQPREPFSAGMEDQARHWLPEPDAEPSKPSLDHAGAPEPATQARPRVLVVDDNGDMRKYIRGLLSPSYDVVTVSDGIAAIESVRIRCPDLVLTDIMMPNLDGLGLLRKLRATSDTASVPVIMLTARAEEETKVEGMVSGADDYLTKPFGARELLARVRGALALAAARRRTADAERIARQQAERVNQLKDDFLATLSHELRTPLNSILGWSQLLLQRSVTPESMWQGLETIERCARLQKTLIDDMLDMGRIVSGTLRVDMQPVHLAGVVQSAVENVRPLADAKRVLLVVDVPQARGCVTGDPVRLQQIVANLLSNAVKFTPESGRVTVRLTESKTSVELCISDTGIGIDADFLPSVFDRFRQEDSTPARRFAGLGLGLSIVKELVELHRGTVRAVSDGPGQGATFVVSLPMSRLDTPEVLRAVDEGPEGLSLLSGLTVLLVDDDPDTRRLVEVILSPYGVHVACAASAEEGMRALLRERPNLVLSDIGMAERDGYTFIAAVRALDDDALRRVPAVAFTAFASPDDGARILTAGYHSHLVKPVEPARLVETLEELTRTFGA